jgi:hypothetical protein
MKKEKPITVKKTQPSVSKKKKTGLMMFKTEDNRSSFKKKKN